jgi:hypothetical protein
MVGACGYPAGKAIAKPAELFYTFPLIDAFLT